MEARSLDNYITLLDNISYFRGEGIYFINCMFFQSKSKDLPFIGKHFSTTKWRHNLQSLKKHYKNYKRQRRSVNDTIRSAEQDIVTKCQ